MSQNSHKPSYALSANAPSGVCMRLEGDWVLGQTIPDVDTLKAELKQQQPASISFDATDIGRWDTALMVFLQQLSDFASETGIEVATQSLPEEACGLLELSLAVPEKKDAARGNKRRGFFTCLGENTIKYTKEFGDLLSFVGECTLATLRWMTGKAHFRKSDFWLIVQQSGAEALPIVALLSFLVGLIFAFVGAVQLQQFGAAIFVANLVGISMTREMGAIITGVIMSGRTGAAFAAAIGSMKVNQEVDALRTLGLSPIEFLVLPRMLALIFMMPMLVIFSNMVGILGGLFVGIVMLDISIMQYINQTMAAVDMIQVLCGITKSFVFAVLVAAAGCLRGLQCGNSSAAVGDATTSAVVTGITAIIVADAIFAFIFEVLGI